MKPNELVTLVLVSYHSEKNLNKFLKQISNNYKIIITENSLNNCLKKEIEENYHNVKVLIPKKNLGNGGGINFALEKVRTKYAFYLDIDIELSEKSIEHLTEIAEIRNNWSILAPNLRDYDYNSDHFIERDEQKKLSKMSFVEGCALFFNLKELHPYGFYDDRIFLYYEEDDLYYKYLKNKLDIILCENIFIKHFGSSSTDMEHKYQIELNRNWHYMWSKFYYFKKNYSYLRGLKETAGHLIKSLIKIPLFYIFNRNKFLIYKNRAMGLLNSYLNKPSSKRPNIK